MILTRESIEAAHERGDIQIEPFEPSLVGINSVDIRLGPDLFGLKQQWIRDLYSPSADQWERQEIYTTEQIRELYPNQQWRNLPDDARCFIFRSGGFYLGTTLEAIGTAPNSAIVPEMRARSTTGRQGLTVSLCAGVGDIGYTGRWALEIRPVDQGDVVLAVGTPIGQIIFHRAEPTETAYGGSDRYQDGDSVRFLPKPLRVVR